MGFPSIRLGRTTLIRLDEELPSHRLHSSQPSSPKRPKIQSHPSTKFGDSNNDTANLTDISIPTTDTATQHTAKSPSLVPYVTMHPQSVTPATAPPNVTVPTNTETSSRSTREKAAGTTDAMINYTALVTAEERFTQSTSTAALPSSNSGANQVPQDYSPTCQRVQDDSHTCHRAQDDSHTCQQVQDDSHTCQRVQATAFHTTTTTHPHQKTPAPTVANQRNATRLAREHTNNRSIIGMSDLNSSHSNLTLPPPTPPLNSTFKNNNKTTTHLSNDVSDLLPPPFRPTGPDKTYPANWLDLIKLILHFPTPTPTHPKVRFEVSTEAALHNAECISAQGYDIEALIHSNPGSTMSHGSEFRNTEMLQLIFYVHPLWPYMKSILTSGADFIFKSEPDEASRLQENNDLLEYANHKSAKAMPEVISSSLADEVSYGFAIAIPNSMVNKIKHSMVVPLGIAVQYSIKKDGSRKEKHRLTHDQTFAYNPDSVSSNKAIDSSLLPDLIYGHCFSRVIHQIAALRLRHPGQVIFIAKFDFSKAYRRASHSGLSAARCTSTHNGLAYIQLRLSFEGKGCPPAWCSISEITTDLANDLLLCETWHPDDIRSPVQHLIPTEERLPLHTPFAAALSLALEPPAHPEGKSDCFVDDVITVFLDSPVNCKRAPAAVPLAIHIVNRPLADDEPIPRSMLLAEDKLLSEGGPRKQAIVLGWLICTRSLTVSLRRRKVQNI